MRLVWVHGEDRDAYLDTWEAEWARFEKDFGFTWAFDRRGQHYLNLHALALSAEEHETLQTAHREVVALFHHVQMHVRLYPEVLTFLGIPTELRSFCLSSPLPYLTAMGRFDWHWTPQGPALLAFNSETPLGQIEACGLQPLIAERCHPYLRDPNQLLGEQLRASLRDSFTRQGGHASSVTGIVGFPSNPEEEATLRLMRRLAHFPGATIIGDIQLLTVNDDQRLCLGDAPLDFLQSFASIEWYTPERDGGALVTALQSEQLHLINPPSTLVLRSNALFALIWLLKGHLPLSLQKVVTKYIPYTSFDPEPLIGQPTMIKPLQQRENQSIRWSSSLLLTDCHEENYVYQRLVPSEALAFPVMRNGRVQMRKLVPAISTFSAQDQPAGYFTRLGTTVLSTQDVCWVPTLVE
ncbi:glutathionylspermidine synthase family protein [Heliophilum fasciatum]|uniref:Glutathionylspermidine synthase n=1 Tax=Heliophilum fasciatum TaxID=35700 RepID=A0A4R2S938_9FIRM|nr:glutathionylspermidine synthase family protein [Heliophilum fasciatum]MCW2276688.1 glutathionylspermidine synthase [Heliophilum fasciatum]TCP68931.1 glutathionylspermidine synthase [Heliophilum fasciatum]